MCENEEDLREEVEFIDGPLKGHKKDVAKGSKELWHPNQSAFKGENDKIIYTIYKRKRGTNKFTSL
jgi:hypothetical protein